MNLRSIEQRYKRDESYEELRDTDKSLFRGGFLKGNQAISETITNFDLLPDAAHVRLPVVKILYGCSSATVWRSVKSKLIPAPQRFAARVTAWNVGELRKSLANMK